MALEDGVVGDRHAESLMSASQAKAVLYPLSPAILPSNPKSAVTVDRLGKKWPMMVPNPILEFGLLQLISRGLTLRSRPPGPGGITTTRRTQWALLRMLQEAGQFGAQLPDGGCILGCLFSTPSRAKDLLIPNQYY